jgi:lycopene beta-cyclase
MAVQAEPSRVKRITVVGAGPAAVSLAAALQRRGQLVTVRAPGGLKPQGHTLCAFVDQLDDAVIGDRFPRCLVETDAGTVDLQRAYARIDDTHGRAALAEACTVLDGRVDASTVWPTGEVVVDATGHAPVLLRRENAEQAWQSAFGIVVRGTDVQLPPGTALFMDWRGAGVDDGGPPSFLYALSGDDGRLLLEETTLASWSPVPTAILRTRLEARLRRRGTVIDQVLGDEVVCFPMAGGLPRRGQHVAGFGASLGLVSPVSGYSVARALALAPVVADAIVAADADGVGDAVVDAVWTPEARSLRTLQRFALTAACGFSQREASAFFGAFFALPAPQWRGFLDGTDAVKQARSTMLTLFSTVTSSLRFRLMAGAWSRNGVAVATDLLRPFFGAGSGRAKPFLTTTLV